MSLKRRAENCLLQRINQYIKKPTPQEESYSPEESKENIFGSIPYEVIVETKDIQQPGPNGIQENKSGESRRENELEELSLWNIWPFPKYERSKNKERNEATVSIIISTQVKSELKEIVECDNQKEKAKKMMGHQMKANQLKAKKLGLSKGMRN
ncbi:hypothetical protein HHI36_004921 [Cryptolaemus montrouzieri]|uniref:Uncharacterized protein n=1 Tax=Cryptolaemus montrouzieri TaxID=559131 RepID=A0ABD2NT66_9CUCU